MQQALTTVYDAVRYDLVVDYSQPPEVPLPPEANDWVQERVRQWQRAQEANLTPPPAA